MSSEAPRILLVDDERSVQTLLTYPLRKDGYDVITASTGQEALDRFREGQFDLVVLDVMLPEVDGYDVCRRLRAESAVPIIMLTAKAEELDKVLGLELGADEEPLVHDELTIDFAKRSVELRGEPIRLTYVEFEILSALARSPGRVFSRSMLLERLWGDSSYRDPRTIDVHIRHLREKLERDPAAPELIFTVRGVGYHFRDR